MRLTTGSRLGPYEISSPLGAGGMGEVYRARDARLERDVAIKVLPESVASDEEALARFQREAKAVAMLSHPNIVSIFDVGRTDAIAYVVMELLDGRTLRQELESGPIPESSALEYALQIASGLSAAHAKGIVHRDLKPENVLVTKSGHLKILDFGLAKRLGVPQDGRTSEETLSQRTEPGAVLGTLSYMSPEQLRGLPVDQRSDIFSFGAILYELLSGRKAFQRASGPETMSAILNEDPPALGGAFAPVVARCLRKEPGARFRSAEDLVLELRQTPPPQRSGVPVSIRPKRVALAGAAVAAAIGLVALGLAVPRRFHAVPEKKSVAVLPFVNMSSDKENEYFSDGVTEDLITALSKVSGLQVAARTSSFAFKGKNEDVRTIGARLGVSAVLEGSVAKSGERVRVTAQLVDTANGYHLWSETYDRELEDIFALRSQLAQTVASALRVTLLSTEVAKLDKKPTQDVGAYQLYLKGRHEISTFTAEGYENGIRHLQEAIARDPGYALAHLGTAYYYVASVDVIPGSEALPRGRAAAKKALELDPELAEAHADLGWIAWLLDHDHAAADREFAAAVALQPRLAVVREYHGWYLVAVGRTEEGLAEARRAVELDPLSPEANTVLGFDLYFARRKDEAAAQLRTTISMDPEYGWAREYLGRLYTHSGRPADALLELEHARRLLGDVLETAPIGIAHAARGETAEARRALDTLAGLRKTQYVPAYFDAVLHAALGEHDRAFELLAKAVEERGLFSGWLGVDPDLDMLREDPRFATLLGTVGAKDR